MPTTIDALMKLRLLAEDNARRELAENLAHEAEAKIAAAAAESHICAESKIASDLGVGDGVVESFAAWLPTGKAQLQLARNAYERASANVVLARATMHLAHAASQTTETYIRRLSDRARQAITKSNQLDLDEVGGRSSSVEEP